MMTMTIDHHNQHRFGPLAFDHMSSYSGHPPFTSPWASSSTQAGPQSGSQPQHNLYVGSNQDTSGLPHLNISALPKHPQHSHHHHHPATQHGNRTSGNTSMAPYGSIPVTAGPAGSTPMAGVYRQPDLLPMPQDLLNLNRLQHPTTSAAYDTAAYTTAATPANTTYPTTSPSPYDQLGYTPAPMRGSFPLAPEDSSRRYSQQSVASSFVDLGPSADDE